MIRGRRFAWPKAIRTLAILAAAIRVAVTPGAGEATPVEVTPEEATRAAAIQEAGATQAVAIQAEGLGDLAMAGRISRTIRKFSRCFVPQGC
jgi:hypothetical protein